jgi:SOS-response transcriptional repressor LexA
MSGSIVIIEGNIIVGEGTWVRDPYGEDKSAVQCQGHWKNKIESEIYDIPIMGWIAAGPFQSVVVETEYSTESIKMTSDLVPYQDGLYALRVDGTSMNRIICDRDLVVMKHQSDADNGDIVAVCADGVDDEVTLKRYYRHEPSGVIWLRYYTEELPRKSITLEPSDPNRKRFRIQGKLIAVFHITLGS